MVTGFDILGHDAGLRKHWLLRMLAILIDMMIVFFAVGLVLLFLNMDTVLVAGVSASIALFLYSGIMEMVGGATIGKKALGLKVISIGVDKNMAGAFLRNIPKAFWYILLPIDTLIGFAGRGDPRQRSFDRMAGTTVVHSGDPETINKLQSAMEERGLEDAVCHSCGGGLVPTSGDKFQCQECGVIQ